MGTVVDLIDNLLDEWYPGLNSDSSFAAIKVERIVPCDSCKVTGDPFYFTIEDCIIASDKSTTIECDFCGPRQLKIIAPDVMFADIDPELIQENCKIENRQSRNLENLGHGAFADVYKAKVNGTNLAVKVSFFL